MTWTTAPTSPGAYLWRLREGDDYIQFVNFEILHDEKRVMRFLAGTQGTEHIGGYFLPITAIIDACERIAELERRVGAMEAAHASLDSRTFHTQIIGPRRERLADPKQVQELVEAMNIAAAERKPASGKCKTGAEWRERHGKSARMYDSGHGTKFYWDRFYADIKNEMTPSQLPETVFSHIRNRLGQLPTGNTVGFWYETNTAAIAALDAALLACGEIEPEAISLPTATQRGPANDWKCPKCGNSFQNGKPVDLPRT